MGNVYIHQLKKWPHFQWDTEHIAELLADVRYRQGRLLGYMEGLGSSLQEEATLETLTLDVLKSSEIEGEILDHDQVRSSIARRLGMEIAGLIPADQNVEGVVEMMLDATQRYDKLLTTERLFEWHASMFPTGYSGMYKIVVGTWRDNAKDDPMQVVSGGMGREKIHFQAPDSDKLDAEMHQFLDWFNLQSTIDPIIKAAVAHLWFVTIHPFDDGNGRIARAITDMQLARADETFRRFYSMSAQIRVERKGYYDILESTQKGSLDITAWIEWFLLCLRRALSATDETLATVIRKATFWRHPSSHNLNDRQRLMLNKLLDGFEGKFTSSKWAKMAKCSQDTAIRDIQDLIDRNILVKEPTGGRSTSYLVNEGLFRE
ncbi:Fic family protein [Chitinophaga agrisoli]|uniref:Fic family protein n=1 Tax=Chitinophaga agrisoli TaxID=2607653 RepID=A0A5B2VXM8_9BACT|nr:Fic family protein [Chitinophaga agrisoli]KAA2243072.1 Fic family protein [Chitinophaga agrisoli]